MGIKFISPEKWPANSPDLNPLDYFFWNEIEVRLKKETYANREEMVEKKIKKSPKKFQ